MAVGTNISELPRGYEGRITVCYYYGSARDISFKCGRAVMKAKEGLGEAIVKPQKV